MARDATNVEVEVRLLAGVLRHGLRKNGRVEPFSSCSLHPARKKGSNHMDLLREFERTGLRLELPRDPIRSWNAEIFQMDIRRHRGREWFRLWRGHETNHVHVSDLDRGRRQLVLLVQESSRMFTERLRTRDVHRGQVMQAVTGGN